MNKASDVLKNSPSLLTSFLQKSDNSTHAGAAITASIPHARRNDYAPGKIRAFDVNLNGHSAAVGLHDSWSHHSYSGLAETRRRRWRFLRRRHCRSRYHRLRILTRSGLRWGLIRPPHASGVFPGIHELGILDRKSVV